MLVLTRKSDEAIVIGDSIRVTVVEVRGNKVRLGIEAPSHVSIHRGELESRGFLDFLDLSVDDDSHACCA